MKKTLIRFFKNNRAVIFLTVIFLMAAFLRFWKLESIPPGLYPDEAANINDAISQPGRIFYPGNNGREGLFFNLLYLSSLIFGKSIFAMRFVSAFLGTVTIIGVFLMTKEMFRIKYDLLKSENIALLASFFTAFSFWHINFSRIIFRAILVPLVLSFSFYFLFKGFRNTSSGKKDISSFVFAGIIFGIGFHTYIAFRMAVLLLGASLILFYFYSRNKRGFLVSVAVFLFFCFIVALPIGIYFLNNPEHFIGRATGVSIFSQENILKSFTKSFVQHLGMFNFSGDYNWRHNIAGSPVLFWPVGILFLIGLFSLVFKKKVWQESLILLFLLSWIFAMLLPGVLTYEGIPHSLRTIGVIPSVFIFSSLGFFFLKDKVINLIKKGKISYWLLAIALIFFSASFTFAQYSRYFVIWGKEPEVKNAFSESYVKIGEYLNSLPSETKKFVIVEHRGIPIEYPEKVPVAAQTTIFIEKTKFEEPRAEYIIPENLERISSFKENNPGKEIKVFPLNYNENLILDLWKEIPKGKIEFKNEVWVYTIN